MFKNFGHFLAAVAAAEQPATRSQANQQLRSAAGASEAVPNDGGFLVPYTFSEKLVQRMYNSGAILSRCFQLPITQGSSVIYPQLDESSRQDGSRFGGARSYWANEADAFTATKPRFLRSELTAKKLIGLCYITEELYRDTAALDIWGQAVFSQEVAWKVEQAIVTGDGDGKPFGITGSNALIQVPKGSGQAAGTITGQNIVDVFSRTWAPSQRSAVWIGHPDAISQCITATVPVGTGGGSSIPLYQATEDPDNQPFNLILGRPIIPCEYSPTPGTPGDLMLCDFSRYCLAIREGDPQEVVSMHVKFLTDEMAYRVTLRVDGAPIDPRPLTPFSGTNTVSPFVAIAAR
jgi:HK97 family phage major capsid protein